MVIRKEHALTILKVRESGTFMPEEETPYLIELERMDILKISKSLNYSLTYWGFLMGSQFR